MGRGESADLSEKRLRYSTTPAAPSKERSSPRASSRCACVWFGVRGSCAAAHFAYAGVVSSERSVCVNASESKFVVQGGTCPQTVQAEHGEKVVVVCQQPAKAEPTMKDCETIITI